MHTKSLKPLFNFEEMSIPTMNSNGLTQHDILSVSQFNRDNLSYIFSRAREMREMVERVGGTDLLKGKVLACLSL